MTDHILLIPTDEAAWDAVFAKHVQCVGILAEAEKGLELRRCGS